eukprot:295002-Karenia_brevis.AAC.1
MMHMIRNKSKGCPELAAWIGGLLHASNCVPQTSQHMLFQPRAKCPPGRASSYKQVALRTGLDQG